ncbi:methyltransferase domain-containing protein [Candidatus Woesearchaeota archaeon]|nr:methyltransferase domain-containing protein [Candidatus Woesearchaeota archaeon]
MNNKEYEKILLCPGCHGEIRISDKIVCGNPGCKREYNIIDDIPIMVLGQSEKVKQEIIQAKTQNKGIFNKKIFGIPYYKVDYTIKKNLYNLFGIKLPKLKDQRDYWLRRGNEYCNEFQKKGYETLEIFFQDLAIKELKKLKFNSIFEAGCGFGWNIKRFKKEFPKARVGGLDFSHTQLFNGKNKYIRDDSILLTEGDATRMPFKDNAYDVGFSLGVFMNINKKKIDKAINEMVRVCKKYIIHLEYDEDNTTDDLRKRRAFKTNIISHNYKKLYEKRGLKIIKMLTYKDFLDDYSSFMRDKRAEVNRWEQWEGPGKYILIIVKNNKSEA